MPEAAGDRAVNVIRIEEKGKEKAEVPEVMEVKKKKTSGGSPIKKSVYHV